MIERPEPDIDFADGTKIRYSEARVLWEHGDFSDTVARRGGWPITVAHRACDEVVEEETCEDALSDDTWDK